MLTNGRWQSQSNGFHQKQSEDIRLLVEKVGAKYRVLVTRVIDRMRPDDVVYAGSAANADEAMATAERVAAVAPYYPVMGRQAGPVGSKAL